MITITTEEKKHGKNFIAIDIEQTFQDISSNYNDVKFLTISLYLKN